jgi:hypothetical protein
MSLDADCLELEITPNLQLFVTFEMSLKEVCHAIDTKFHYKLISTLEVESCELKFLEKSSLQIGHDNDMSLE